MTSSRRLLIVQGQEYERPEVGDMTLEELEMASDLGAKLPTEKGAAMDARWLRAIVVVAKLRAGETIYPDALLKLRLSDIEFAGDDTNGAAPLVPPPNRAARRAKPKPSGAPETTHA